MIKLIKLIKFGLTKFNGICIGNIKKYSYLCIVVETERVKVYPAWIGDV